MDILISLVRFIGILGLVILLFNLMIGVHELGHFLAGRWRGLYIDRFQIWFGKPIWKKKINGVQYGLGWLPLGGFVSLPQMAPMEGIEGEFETPDGKPLPKVSPIDKIIVAFAGPLFSFLLAVVFAVLVSFIGYPDMGTDDNPETATKVGWVVPGSEAEKAGFQVGDVIRKIDGQEVKKWVGAIDAVVSRIPLSTGKQIEFEVERDGALLTIVSGYNDKAPVNTKAGPVKGFLQGIFKRPPMRQVGIGAWDDEIIVGELGDSKGDQAYRAKVENSPLFEALKPGDRLLTANQTKLTSLGIVEDILKQNPGKPVDLGILRDGEETTLTLTPVFPISGGTKEYPDLGGFPRPDTIILKKEGIGTLLVTPFKMVYRTLAAVINPNSSVGPGHLSGALGIGNLLYRLFDMPDGWRLVLWITVLININLAILNMLPLPVLDGGHIVMALYEKITGRPLPQKLLEWVMQIAVILLLMFMLYVTLKDAGDIHSQNSGEPVRYAPAGEAAPQVEPLKEAA